MGRRRTISIHALRVEGDCNRHPDRGCQIHFYPRPPGGGRRIKQIVSGIKDLFLSTPSGWRATARNLQVKLQNLQFLSTPSGWRATELPVVPDLPDFISIHALRVEGDPFASGASPLRAGFLSTPSGWRATIKHFANFDSCAFLSTPSGWRATSSAPRPGPTNSRISIHALRVEGDYPSFQLSTGLPQFLSTPSGWRATFLPSSSVARAPRFLSTPSGWRATSAESLCG